MQVSNRNSSKCGAISARGSTLAQYKAKVEGAMGSSLSLGLSACSLNARAGPQGKARGLPSPFHRGPSGR